jgi:glycosyltransferase involved in cell wall biosynthesis
VDSCASGVVVTIYVYPADTTGCGHYRLIWPAQVVQQLGLDVKIIHPSERNLETSLSGKVRGNELQKVTYPKDATLIILQRPTHKILHQAVKLLREEEGIPVIIDMDDDLSCIHPANPAFTAMHPKNDRTGHNWRYAEIACKEASLVTTSTEALAQRYASHGRSRVLYNCIPQRFLEIPVPERTHFGWAGSLHSHPDDLDPLGSSVSQLTRMGYQFKVISSGKGVAKKLHLAGEVEDTGIVPMVQWPNAVNQLKVGIAPLADTRFNKAKSWLKPLEYSALGIPWVASPREEYMRLQKYGGGLLADKTGKWVSSVKRLMDNESFYKEQSEKVKEIASQFTYEHRAHYWAETWTSVIASGP